MPPCLCVLVCTWLSTYSIQRRTDRAGERHCDRDRRCRGQDPQGARPGLFESVYEVILGHELKERGLGVRSQVPLPAVYETIKLARGFRADLIVENAVIVEVKSVDGIAQLHRTQLLTYLRLADVRLGILLNFNSSLMREGITRVIN